MKLRSITITDSSPAKVTRFAEILWERHPEIIDLIGDDNITPIPVDSDFGGIGNEGLLREVRISLIARFPHDMPVERARELVSSLNEIRRISIEVGLDIDEEVTDYIDPLY